MMDVYQVVVKKGDIAHKEFGAPEFDYLYRDRGQLYKVLLKRSAEFAVMNGYDLQKSGVWEVTLTPMPGVEGKPFSVHLSGWNIIDNEEQ
jgi:hypothetical protein